MKATLKTKLIDVLESAKSLPEIYEVLPDEKEHSIRARLNENVGKVFKRISKGIYIAEKNGTQAIIIQGDAWEKIKEFEDDSFDTIITDSPYSCLNKHYETGSTRQRNLNKSVGFATNDIDEPLLKEMLRILKPHGHLFSFAPPDAADTLDYNDGFLKTAREVGFTFNKRLIWDKAVFGMGYSFRNQYEQIFFLSKGDRRKGLNFSIPDVLTHKRIAAHNRIHDAEKPVELIVDLMKFSNKKNDVVLDLFAGSLSLMEAGFKQGVNTVSVELDGAMIKKSLEAKGMTAVLI